MQTITFYSYKGGTGRSLALANAARYLARLDFKVIAIDFDLEAPGLHYKFSTSLDGAPLPVKIGVVDYLYAFVVDGKTPLSLKDFLVDVVVPGVSEPLVQLFPAGRVPASDYWSKLSKIDWHKLFYSEDAKGVPVFLELKNRIQDELNPDFLLIDSRTGITEMGGVATTVLADTVVCMVLPGQENLEGSRAVLRSLKRSRRESGSGSPDVIVALSRLPTMNEPEIERRVVDGIRSFMDDNADQLEDTLMCGEIFVLHSESILQIREALRVGGSMSPDDSVLLRDYLRLFAKLVPRPLIEPKVVKLVEDAKRKIWQDADAALKEVEELAESFGHPDIYRDLMLFYKVRSVSGTPALKRAQRYWDVARDAGDLNLWEVVKRSYDPVPRHRAGAAWTPNTEFLKAVWREAGRRDVDFALKLVRSYVSDDEESRAADILLEVIKEVGPSAEVVARCLALLDSADRMDQADTLISELRPQFGTDAGFVESWARHVLRMDRKDEDLFQPQVLSVLEQVSPVVAARVYIAAGLPDRASLLGDAALRRGMDRPGTDPRELAELFIAIGRFEEFENAFAGRISPGLFEEFRQLSRGVRRRQGSRM